MSIDPAIACFDQPGHRLHEINARLRTAGPAVPVDLLDGVRAWSVTRYDVLRRLTKDERVSRDAQRHWPALPSVPTTWPLHQFLVSPTVLNAYGADHTRLRTAMQGAFSTAHVRDLGIALRERVPVLLDSLGTSGSGEVVDVRAEYAHVLAGETICDLFGVDRSQREETKAVIHAFTVPSPDGDPAAVTHSTLEFLRSLLRPGSPDLSLISTLLSSGLTDEERVLALAVTVAGGVPSSTGLITNAVHALLTHPGQLSSVTGGDTSWAAVVEETLRADAPVQHMPLRYAVADIDLGEGVVIKQGEAIIMGFGAGGRDPQVNGPTAAVFDAGREDRTHLAFGYGVHRCIAEPLGRLLAVTALSALFERFPQLRLATPSAELPLLPTFVFHGKASLPVVL
ncbi:cytochrome P450 [Streptomyces sp. NPDC059861]|uniref:cytochrome P450 n=1 Tax=Streptomyces sp. NPDC059861 TaxID=3346974 RepID=UPI003666DBF0